MVASVSAVQATAVVTAVLDGLPVFLAGSSATAARTPGFEHCYDDIDVFCSTPQALISSAEKLIATGFEITDRYKRVYHRWLKHGFKGWHTNSLKLKNLTTGLDVNLVYKTIDKKPTTTLAQVIESFDFGVLAVGYDCETGEWRDMRSYLFPSYTIDPVNPVLPLLPERRKDWRSGFITQYHGLRQLNRFIRYMDYGYDMSLAYEDMVMGYQQASIFYTARTDRPDLEALGRIFESIAMQMEDAHKLDDWDSLRAASSEIIYLDELDSILEALE